VGVRNVVNEASARNPRLLRVSGPRPSRELNGFASGGCWRSHADSRKILVFFCLQSVAHTCRGVLPSCRKDLAFVVRSVRLNRRTNYTPRCFVLRGVSYPDSRGNLIIRFDKARQMGCLLCYQEIIFLQLGTTAGRRIDA